MSLRYVIAGLLGIASVGFGIALGTPRDQEAGVAYLTAPVERGDVSTTLSATGKLRALVTVQVGSQLSGQIAELLVDFNDARRRS